MAKRHQRGNRENRKPKAERPKTPAETSPLARTLGTEIEGDVAGAEINIGEQGKVTGTVAAERVIVRGRTSGVIRAMAVALQASARVEGDIHHMSLAIEQGAQFDGRCRRFSSPGELQLDLEAHG